MSSVKVSNLAPNTSQTTISEFFSFCGKIVAMSVSKSATADTLEAIVTFESPAAAKTSLLLTNALINDRPIHVDMASEETPLPSGEANPNIVNRPHEVPADQRSATSVIASVMAAGYKLGDDTLSSARDFDAKHSLTAKISSVAAAGKEKLSELDTKLGVSEKAKAVSDAVGTKVHAVDEQFGLSEKAGNLSNAANAMFTTFARAASSTLESIAHKGADLAETHFPNAVGHIKDAGEGISNTVSTIKTEADQKYYDQKGVQNPAAAAPLPHPADPSVQAGEGETEQSHLIVPTVHDASTPAPADATTPSV